MLYLNPFALFENVAQAKALLNKLGIANTNEDFIKINKMLSGNGYVYWFTKLFFVDKVEFEELENVWSIIKTEPQIISKFKTPVVSLESLEKFWDEYLLCKGLSNAKSIYNEFPSLQKGFINLKNDADILLLNDLFRDKDRSNFIKKVSRYHKRNDFIESLRLFLYNKTENAFEKLLDMLKADGVNIKYANEEKDIIVTTVNYPQLKKYGGDTSWCIVGSKGTFDSYNSRPLSQQFIIFLLDRKDNYSKIGVTTNMNGISTAHLKNDEYIKSQMVIQILKDRDCETGMLYATKENALDISWVYTSSTVLQNIGFSDEQILKKKRDDIKKEDWGLLSVYFLINSGITKEEIVKGKTVFGVYTGYYLLNDKLVNVTPPKSDLEFFTKDEIEKWKLMDKTVLKVTDLVAFSKEEIIKKNLLSRVTQMKLYQLGSLGFNFKEIIKLSKTTMFAGDQITPIISGKSRPQVIRLIKDYRTQDNVRQQLVYIVGITSEDLSFDELYRYFSSKSFDHISSLKFFGNFYELTKENVKKLLSHLYSKYLISLSELVFKNIYRDIALELINDYTGESPINYDIMGSIRANLSDFTEVYEVLYNKMKDYIFKKGGYYMLRIRSDRDVNVRSTILNLNFWGASAELMSVDDIVSIFNGAGLGSGSAIVEYCKKINIDLSGYGLKLARSLGNYHDDIDNLKFCIENLIDVDDSYNSIISFMRGKKDKISDYDLSKVKSLLSNRPEYEEEFEKFEQKNIMSDAILKTKEVSDYTWSRNRSKITLEQWYEKYWPIIKKLDFNRLGEYVSDYDSLSYVATIIVLIKLGKLEEALNIPFDFISKSTSHSTFTGNNPLVDLAKVVADKAITNWRRTWMKLEDSEREMLYKFLDTKVSEYVKEGSENTMNILSKMSICWFIYDKTKLNRYIDLVKKLKNNYEYVGNGGLKRYKTYRLKELEKLFVYLAEENKFDEIENIISQFKFTKPELKDSQGLCGRANLFYARNDGDDLYAAKDGDKVRSERKKKLNSIIQKYLSPIKESFILRWNSFNI